MIRYALIASLVLLAGCENQTRNTPAQQAEDYAICTKAGMQAYLSYYGEVKCSPPKLAQSKRGGGE